MKESIFLFFFC